MGPWPKLSTVSQSPAETVVRRYADELYGRRNLAIIPELVSDPTIRHEPSGETLTYTLADSLARAEHLQAEFASMRFDEVAFISNDTDVCWVFDAVLVRADGSEVTMCGVEVFRVQIGRAHV